MKKEEKRKRSHTESRGAVYLPCFGLVLDSLFGLFLSHCNVVHWLGHVLLYVVYYIALEKTTVVKSSTFNQQKYSIAQFALHLAQVVNETSTLRQTLRLKELPAFPRKDANNNTNSRATPLPQTWLSLRKHGASSNKHVVRLREDERSSVHVCVGCNVKWALVSAVMPYSYSLLKRIQVDSTRTEWWDGRCGRRDEKETLRKKWSWKRGDRQKCRFVVRGEERINRKAKIKPSWAEVQSGWKDEGKAAAWRAGGWAVPGSPPAWRCLQTCRAALWCCSPGGRCPCVWIRSHSGLVWRCRSPRSALGEQGR